MMLGARMNKGMRLLVEPLVAWRPGARFVAESLFTK
jgi:hypothetical protein